MMEQVFGEQIYQEVILKRVLCTRRFLWIATADLKDLFVQSGKKKGFVPFLEVMSDLIQRGAEIRLIHAKEPGPRFRKDFDKYPALTESDRLERLLCPRMHMKAIIVDGVFMYSGSANLTGAGMGAKSADGRNFESGFITDDKHFIRQMMDEYDAVFSGERCFNCKRKEICPDPIA